jgi:hypothetical protein
VEVEDPRAIKAILTAELQGKVTQTANTNILIQNTTHVYEQVEDKATKEKPQFIKDDRQRETPSHYTVHNTENR